MGPADRPCRLDCGARRGAVEAGLVRSAAVMSRCSARIRKKWSITKVLYGNLNADDIVLLVALQKLIDNIDAIRLVREEILGICLPQLDDSGKNFGIGSFVVADEKALGRDTYDGPQLRVLLRTAAFQIRAKLCNVVIWNIRRLVTDDGGIPKGAFIQSKFQLTPHFRIKSLWKILNVHIVK